MSLPEYENAKELIESRATIADYIGVLDSLFLTCDQEAFSIQYRSSARVGKSAKRHLVGPSLSCACLHLTADKLMNDHETFGLLFEALVERDLRIYADYLGGIYTISATTLRETRWTPSWDSRTGRTQLLRSS